MSLAPQLNAVLEGFKNAPTAIKEPIIKSQADIIASFDPKKAIQPGTKLPLFALSDATGKQVSSADLLAKGPLLINFYRGEWCPFCNIELRALQQRLPEFESKGVTLVAISPELPNTSLTTTEKHELKFTVLSDVGNKFARELGIVWDMPDELRPIFDKLGHDLKAKNGDDSFAVPIPATILVDGKGVVRNVYAEPNYTKRLEPQVIMEWIDAFSPYDPIQDSLGITSSTISKSAPIERVSI
ncbi:Peroxiredoxin Q-chloroplastic-like protein [Lachnellula suecica]|uniref:thioredoxin-dependent peroxiredoxin n=1 Tax=Lachnellula suecica TaxID=602035 RepID=A0A8T9C5U6_9HELO|nr:Peroxiredoxin Q-chloroplastic-like protein [Lachnellula suecica]